MTTEYLEMITNWWSRLLCTTQCDLDTQHYHTVFTPDRTPKEYVMKLTIYFYQDKECSNAHSLHAHQYGDDSRKVEIEVPSLIRVRIWSGQDDPMGEQTLSVMMAKEEGPISIPIDERDAQIYASAEFECFQANCPLYFTNHFHI